MKKRTINRQTVRQNNPLSFCPCRHLENGRTSIPKICIYNYECWKCAFDQWLDELDTRQEPLTAAA